MSVDVLVIETVEVSTLTIITEGPQGPSGAFATADNISLVPAGDIESDNVQDAIYELDNEKLGVDSLSANVSLYPTSVASDIGGGYLKLVSDVTDADYDDPAVDISTGEISGADQLLASLASDPGLIVGDPGILNVTIIGNIRRTAGNSTATFHFHLFHRTAAGVETELAISNNTLEVGSSDYVQFSAVALLNNGVFLATDRLVIKFYADKIGTATNPTYDFQFGGDLPVRALIPLPLNVSSYINKDNIDENISAFSSMCLDQQSLFLTYSGADIFFETEKVGGGDLNYLMDSDVKPLDCTTGTGVGGRAKVQLTAGTAISPVLNYVYITLAAGVATLTASTTPPTGEFAIVAILGVQDSVTTAANGPLTSQRATEALNHSGRGALAYMREKLRALGAKFFSGAAQNLTITPNGAAADTVGFTTAGGEVFQLHRQDWDAYDISTMGLWVANASGAGLLTKNQKVTDINQLLETADGTAIGNLDRFNLVFWGAMNSDVDGVPQQKMFVNLPTDVYSKDADALADNESFSVTTLPENFQGTGFLVARTPLKYTTAASGTWVNLRGGTNVINLLGLLPGFNLGGVGAPSSNVFSDALFRIYSAAASAVELVFDLSGLTASRTLAAPDASGTIALVETLRTLLGQYDTRTDLTATDASTMTLDFSLGNLFLIDASAMGAGESFIIAMDNLTTGLTGPAWRIIIKTGVNLPTISWPNQDPLVAAPVIVVSASNEIIGRNYNETPNYNVHTLGQVLT